MRNTLFHIRRNSTLTKKFNLEDLIYVTCLSSVEKYTEEESGITYGLFSKGFELLSEYFSDWSEDEFIKAINSLGEQGLLMYGIEGSEEADNVYVGTFEARRFEPFSSAENTLYQDATEKVTQAVKSSVLPKARNLYIKGRLNSMIEKGAENLNVNDFNELHGILYEIYTGGEDYKIRNKTELFQTSNILKAYDHATTFAIITEAVLNFDLYRKKGVPTLINVGYLKDDVFRKLVHKDTSTKEYMREKDDDENEF